jgi:hypothetical protein
MANESRQAQTARFLSTWCSPFPAVLTAIHPDNGHIVTAGFAPGGDEDIANFLGRYNGHYGLYFGVNGDCRAAAAISTKSRKGHISHALAAHLDIDVYKHGDADKATVVKKLHQPPPGVPGPPGLVINSGNGLQAFWRFNAPYQLKAVPHRLARIEGINRRLAELFGGDHTHDITRVMRVPGTVNLPNKIKRAMGLQPVVSSIVSFDEDCRYDLEKFGGAWARPTRTMSAHLLEIGGPDHVEALDSLIVPETTKLLIALGARPGVERASRSEWLFSAILSMIRCGERNETILGVITDERWAISASVLDKPDPDHHGRRQIRRAHAWLSGTVREDFPDEQ